VRDDGKEDLEPVRGALRRDHGCQMVGIGQGKPAQGCGEDRDAGRVEEILQGKQIGLCGVAMNESKTESLKAAIMKSVDREIKLLTRFPHTIKSEIKIEFNVNQGGIGDVYVTHQAREKMNI